MNALRTAALRIARRVILQRPEGIFARSYGSTMELRKIRHRSTATIRIIAFPDGRCNVHYTYVTRAGEQANRVAIRNVSRRNAMAWAHGYLGIPQAL